MLQIPVISALLKRRHLRRAIPGLEEFRRQCHAIPLLADAQGWSRVGHVAQVVDTADCYRLRSGGGLMRRFLVHNSTGNHHGFVAEFADGKGRILVYSHTRHQREPHFACIPLMQGMVLEPDDDSDAAALIWRGGNWHVLVPQPGRLYKLVCGLNPELPWDASTLEQRLVYYLMAHLPTMA